MINLYKKLTKNCKTINQINRVHILLENWMTASQWFRLSKELLSPNQYNFLLKDPQQRLSSYDDIQRAQHKWFYTMQSMFAKSGYSSSGEFKRFILCPNIRLFKNTNILKSNKKLVICFTGMAQRMMVPLPVFLKQFDSKVCDIALINYPKGKGYRYGLKNLADSFENTIDELGRILDIQSYDKAFAIGVSGGGLPAILAALKLNFKSAISFSGNSYDDPRWQEALGFGLDILIRKFFANSEKKCRLYAVYGADMELDTQSAKKIAEILPCILIKVDDRQKPVGHTSLYSILMDGKFPNLLNETIFKENINPKNRISQSPVHSIQPQRLVALTGPRFFCIGFNKTGTTTMGRCFDILGLTPIAEPRSPFMDFKKLSNTLFNENSYQPALETAKYFRAFQDRPWNIWDMYKLLDSHFENSQFILTERDPESWWNSVHKWLTEVHHLDKEKYLRYLKHLKVNRLDKDLFIGAYNLYNQEVKKYFEGRDNFLVMNLAEGDGWNKLCYFLNLPIPDLPFPHANKQQ